MNTLQDDLDIVCSFVTAIIKLGDDVGGGELENNKKEYLPQRNIVSLFSIG
jgi:hypothetical protein